ncbi:MAG: outer membrane protein assembly factor BamD [Phycisphaerales bacterium]|nr:outer membrane protein assembly factor BamD [Phycisphaerales bacterium]
MPRPPLRAPMLAALLTLAPATLAQQTTYELDPDQGVWVETASPEPGTDAWTIADARKALAAGEAGRAERTLTKWLETYSRTDNPFLAEAYMLRGDARVARGNEYNALYDYETVAKDFASADVFLPTLEREMRVARMYLNGLRKKFLGIRLEDGSSIGIELLMRTQERAPGSQIAETAAIELADYFYRVRELELAAEMYSIFIVNYPQSDHRMHAMLRQIYANVARFKGPRYDSSTLVEARALIRQFEGEYPEQAEQLGITDALIARLDESAAAQMLASADWYLRRGDEVSARFILQRLVVRHDGTVAAARAADSLAEHDWPTPARPNALPPDLLNAMQRPESSAPADASEPPTTPEQPSEGRP